MNATHSLPTVAEMTFGAGDGMPDCSGTSLRFGTAPAGLNANAFRYYRSTNPVRVDPLERETGFGPATFALARQRSTTEPLPHIYVLIGATEET